MITLEKGAVYKSRHNGMVEYTGLDRFWGETTHRFRRLTCGGTSYVNLDELDDFLEPQDTLESVKQQLAEAQQERQKEHDLRCRLAGELESANQQQAELRAGLEEILQEVINLREDYPAEAWRFDQGMINRLELLAGCGGAS